RVLAFDPNNAVVAAALRRLEGRARLKMAAAVVGITAVVGGATALIGKKLAHRSREGVQSQQVQARPSPPPPAVPATGPIAPPAVPPRRPAGDDRGADAAPVAPTGPKRAGGGPRRATRQAPALFAAPAPVEPVPTRTFTLGPTPQNVDVYLDGRRLFGYD